jgi:hypothetical protein|tara:strand:- start:1271 stop:1630 length:360 start_codon:yes stop_codon:yes gene_type:complete
MAASLSSTGFQSAVDNKVISCTGIDNTTAQVNVANGPGTLHSVTIDSANSSDNVTLHIYDTQDSSVGQIALKGKASSTKSYILPAGYAFTELKFYVSKFSRANDTTAFAGSVNVTLVCS